MLIKVVLPEASSFHRRLVAERGHRYSPEVLANLKAGETISAVEIAIALDEDIRFFTRKSPLLEAAG